MSEETTSPPPWKKLEIVCADLERQLSPSAEVKHNDRIVGRSGSVRKLDITVRQILGTHPILIVFDCKKHKKPVERALVAAFAEQVRDVRANVGVMISESGFDSGAVAVAADTNIILRSYASGSELDWNMAVGPKSWVYITHTTVLSEEIRGVVGGVEQSVAPDRILYDSNSTNLGTMHDFWQTAWKNSRPQMIGRIEVSLSPSNTIFIHDTQLNEYLSISDIKVIADLRTRKYAVNVEFAQGHIMKEFPSQTTVIHRLESRGFNPRDIVKFTEGIELTSDEYIEMQSRGPVVPLDNADPYLRVVIDKKVNKTGVSNTAPLVRRLHE
jgi:hypothetical protein